MKAQNKRLFINNLPDGISQNDLEQKFAVHGVVASVEIKQRKNVRANQTPQFAYIQLGIDENNLQECLKEFSNKKWKGHWIDVQEAKESFMERLKREREELKENGIIKPGTTSVLIHSDDVNTKSETFPIVSTKKYHSSSSETSSDEEQDSGLASAKQEISVVQNGLLAADNDQDGLVIKNNKGKKLTEGLKIESTGITQKAGGKKEIEAKKLGVKEIEADKKRLQSLAQMRKGYQEQKSLIKSALLQIDSKPKNKIVFDDDGNEHLAKKARYEKKTDSQVKRNSNMQDKLALFEDDNEEHEYNFEVKEHFEGKKGQKLMELQSRFKNDKRFAMDARFLEDQSDEESANKEYLKDEDGNVEITQEEEKQKQLEILEEVLGKKVSRRTTADKESSDSKRPKMMLRFDPSQPEHSKYEMKEPPKQEKAKRKRKDSNRQETEAVEEMSKPEVSKDTFYKVAVDLKDALHEKETFSLANMFSKAIEEEETEAQEETNEKSTVIAKKTLTHEQNPFRYDSSSGEDDDEEVKETSAPTDKADKQNTRQFERTKPTRLWTESFFFKDDDYRLQEGLDFIRKLEIVDQDDFHKMRRNLKVIVRAKVKNNQKKNRPFRKKLGGKKRIKVKRAMKR